MAYAPSAVRPALAGLFALDISLGRVVASTTEPMIGAMRLAWWREALERLHLPAAAPAEPVLQLLHERVVAGDAGKAAALAAMTDGWLALIEVEPLDGQALEKHGRERGERLFALAAEILGAPGGDAVALMGFGWALADLAEHVSQPDARVEASAMAAGALAKPFATLPRRARLLTALAALARRDVAAGGRRRAGSPGRQLRMLLAWLTGR